MSPNPPLPFSPDMMAQFFAWFTQFQQAQPTANTGYAPMNLPPIPIPVDPSIVVPAMLSSTAHPSTATSPSVPSTSDVDASSVSPSNAVVNAAVVPRLSCLPTAEPPVRHSSVTVNQSPRSSVISSSAPPAALSSVSTASSAPPTPLSAHDASDDETLKDRYNLNKAMGVDPTNRAAVQARRKEVSDFCLVQFSVALNKPYSQWSAKTWRRLLNGVTHEFEAKYRWTRETAEAVMKKICSDTARNLRASAKRAGVSLPAAGKRDGVTKANHMRPPLRRPNGSSARLHTDTSASTRAAGVENSNEPPSSLQSGAGPSSPPTTASDSSGGKNSTLSSSPIRPRVAPLLPTTPRSMAQLSSPLSPPGSPILPLSAAALPPVLRNDRIEDMELSKASVGDYGLKLLIWKVGITSWNPTQQFNAWLTFMDTLLPVDEDNIYIGKRDNDHEWKPLMFASNYDHAMSSGAARIYIKSVHQSWIDIEDADYEEDLSVCSRF